MNAAGDSRPVNGGAPTESTRDAVLICLCLFLSTALLFSRALGNGFIDLDDPDYVTRNPHVHAGITGESLRWAMTSFDAGNWHPLTWLSHMLDREWFGGEPRGHHATNVLFHALNAAMAFLALRRLTGAFWTSALSAALFAWHPLRVESVAWVAERKDVLSVFFGLAALWAYGFYARPQGGSSATTAGEGARISGHSGARYYILALGLFALSLMCKPMLVTLPFLFLVLDWWPLGRGLGWGKLVLEKAPFLVLSTVSCVLTYLAQEKGGAVIEGETMAGRWQNAIVSVAAYVRDFVWPTHLAVGYPRPDHWSAGTVAEATIAVLAITGVAAWGWRRYPWVTVGWLWFLGTLVPVLGFVQVGLQARADRYTYFPVLGLQLALLWTVREVRWFRSAPWLAGAGAAVLLLLSAVGTWTQLAIWNNSNSLYDHALAVTTDNYLAHGWLGTTLLNNGHTSEAIVQFQKALELKPGFVSVRYRLGLALEKADRDIEALSEYEAFLRARPDNAEAQLRCANLLARLNRDTDALPHYERAIQLKPENDQAQCDYADSLRALNRLGEACRHYQTAVRLQPTNAFAHFGLASGLEGLGRTNDALEHYVEAARLLPGLADAHYNAGVILLKQTEAMEAMVHFQCVVKSQPAYVSAYVGMGLAAERLGRRGEAVKYYEKALELDPAFPGLRQNLDEAQRKQLAETPSNGVR
jgi:tetratricopeptide (TPR) repeat protein